jgi:hypothetical protein
MPAAMINDQQGGFAATMRLIQKDFKWSDELRVATESLGLENLDEFRFYFTSEAQITEWRDTMKSMKDHGFQAAKLCRAWHAVRTQGALRDSDKSVRPTQDLDERSTATP